MDQNIWKIPQYFLEEMYIFENVFIKSSSSVILCSFWSL